MRPRLWTRTRRLQAHSRADSSPSSSSTPGQAPSSARGHRSQRRRAGSGCARRRASARPRAGRIKPPRVSNGVRSAKRRTRARMSRRNPRKMKRTRKTRKRAREEKYPSSSSTPKHGNSSVRGRLAPQQRASWAFGRPLASLPASKGRRTPRAGSDGVTRSQTATTKMRKRKKTTTRKRKRNRPRNQTSTSCRQTRNSVERRNRPSHHRMSASG